MNAVDRAPALTAPTSSPAATPPRRRAWWIAALVAVMAGAVATRAVVQFRDAIPPAMDPAYYPMQAWWLLHEGRLLYQDAPLIFALDGAVAKAMMLAGVAEDRAYLLAAQCVDCVTEPWVALFVFLFGCAWCGGSRRGIPIVAAGAVLAVLSAPVIRMVSDFEKNSLGLAWAAGAWWALWRALGALDERRSPSRVAGRFMIAAAALMLTALTHGGSFGCAAFGTGAIVAAWLAGGGVPRRTLMIGAIATAFVAAGSLAILYAASPSRARTMIAAPLKIFGGDRRAPGGPPPRGAAWATPREGDMPPEAPADFNAGDDTPRDGAPRGFGPPPMGPPGGRESHGTFIGLGVGLAAIAVIAVRWRREKAADRAVVLGLGALSMLLVCPWLNPEYAQRLNLMAPVPVGIVFAFLGARLAVPRDAVSPTRLEAAPRAPRGAAGVRAAASWIVAAGVTWGAIHSIIADPTHGPVISQPQLQELFALRSRIPAPRTTLVIAGHGLEWWAGYALHTPVRSQQVPEDAFTRYSRVVVLRMREGADSAGGRGFDGPGRRGGPSGRGGPGGPRGASEPAVTVPSGAQRVYQGESFELFEVPAPSGSAR
jgi:hypothetical protein